MCGWNTFAALAGGMPEFTAANDAYLKRVMLARAPSFFFTTEDEAQIQERTGLSLDDISSWNRRLQWRMASGALHPEGGSTALYLMSEGEALFEAAEDVEVQRCYVSMLGAGAALAMDFEIPGVAISSTHFCWSPESRMAEGFLDLGEKVSSRVLRDRLRGYGATHVNVTSLDRPGATDMASVDALAHVRNSAMQRGFLLVTRGCSFDDLSVRAEKLSSLLNGNFCDEEIELLRARIAHQNRLLEQLYVKLGDTYKRRRVGDP